MSNIACAVKGLGRESIRSLTQNVRKFTNVYKIKKYDVVEWLELGFIPRSDFEVDVCDDVLLREDHALTDHENKIIHIREDIYDGACKGIGRDRMTIMHEVGHVILHTPDRISHARSFSNKIPTYQDPEWQAKAFAAELLVPADLLEVGMYVGEIADNFGVSLAAAEYQAKIYNRDGLIKLDGPVTDVTDPKIVWTK